VTSLNHSVSRLILGTAQFGLNYGIANRSGQISIQEAKDILQVAHSRGIRLVDTAMAYGDSEQRLGEIGLQGWGVISKITSVPDDVDNIERWVMESVKASLSRLRVRKLHGLLLHDPQQLLRPVGALLYAALLQLKSDHLVEKIGVSIYDPAELDQLCSLFRFDIVQCPFNVLDRRLIDSGWLYRLRNQGTDLHVRSIFLQGLLLLSPETRPVKFSQWDALWSTWQSWLKQAAVSPLQACLNYVLSFPEIDGVVLGIDGVKQLQEIFGTIGRALPAVPPDLQCNDVRLIDPSGWSNLR
jgi:aryl-alcohol dehydrogenase-like predicted oxidoreductase